MTHLRFTTLAARRDAFLVPTNAGIPEHAYGAWRYYLGFVEITAPQYEQARQMLALDAWTEETIINLLSVWGYGPHT